MLCIHIINFYILWRHLTILLCNKSQISWNPLALEMAVIAFMMMMMIANDNNWRWLGLTKANFPFCLAFNRFDAYRRVRAIYVRICNAYTCRVALISSHRILILFNATWLFPRLTGKNIWFHQTNSTVPCEKVCVLFIQSILKMLVIHSTLFHPGYDWPHIKVRQNCCHL